MELRPAGKKNALARGRLRCVGDIATLNVTRGCAGECVFCYARCYSGAPEPGTALVYRDLDRRLRRELDSRKTPMPTYVVMSTACDGFLGGPEVTRITTGCIETLVARNIGVSFSTRGEIPDRALELLGRHHRHVRAFVPLSSMSDDYHRRWEPGTALPRRRLFTIQRLLSVGVRPRVRLDPVIPFVNDESPRLKALFSALAGLGIRKVTASFIHLRPGLIRQLSREAPDDIKSLVLGGFPEAEAFPDRYHHLQITAREASHRRIRRLAGEHRLQVAFCYCNNPGLNTVRCPVPPPEIPQPHRPDQPSLFE